MELILQKDFVSRVELGNNKICTFNIAGCSSVIITLKNIGYKNLTLKLKNIKLMWY